MKELSKVLFNIHVWGFGFVLWEGYGISHSELYLLICSETNSTFVTGFKCFCAY